MEPILSLPPDQFRAALAELALDPEREAFLVNAYNQQNAPQQGAGGRGAMYNLLDNIIGYDDDVVTPGERLGAGIEGFASGLLSDPVGTGADIVRGGYETIERAMAPGATPMDVLGAAGMAMGAGGMAARPAGSVGMGGRVVDGSPNLPPLSNAQRTQIAGTLPTYRRAADILGTSGRGLDYGAGLGLGARELGFDAFEPFPRQGFIPTYTDPAAIPSQAYDRLTNFNVLNVVPREVRDDIVENIGRVIAPGGRGLITTRGRDVLTAQGTPGPEPMSVITSRDTYQKGFRQQELQDYLRYILGSDFEVSPLRLGPAGAEIRRVASPRTSGLLGR